MLTKDQRLLLLRIARRSIEAIFEGRQPETGGAELDEALRRPSGAFVSLHRRDGTLRGCIGSIEPVSPLCDAVAKNAVNAAFRDPRFFPLTREELDAVHIEISVMSPVVRIRDPEDIVVGRDGLIVRSGRYAGLLLPQVATAYGWDRHAFLAQTCRKAGLASDAWKSPECTLEAFSAEVFGEQSLGA